MIVSILEYLGLIHNGVLIIISIIYNDKYYEGTFYYTDKDILLTISKDLEIDLGHKIEEDTNYVSILTDILKKMLPYEEAINQLKPIDFKKWNTNY